MRRKLAFILVATAGLFTCGWYAVEPWALTFIDDGLYYSEEFAGTVDDLPVKSTVELWRFGRTAYILESRLLPNGEQSVFVLRDMSGTLVWARLPVKPDGELGAVELRRASLRWCGGWRVRIVPEHQEAGDLYLGLLGGFRFFNHSW